MDNYLLPQIVTTVIEPIGGYFTDTYIETRSGIHIKVEDEEIGMVATEDEQKIDTALAQYYKDCGRNDYFNERGEGKFEQYARYIYDKNYLKLEFEDRVNDHDQNDWHIVDVIDQIDPMFPMPMSTNESRANDIFQVFKHCYKYGLA
eukprot:745969_1